QSDYDMPIGGNPKMRPCTCEEGHKLDCPMHGLGATKPAYEHIWDLQDHLGPKGGDEDMPRSWIHAIAADQYDTREYPDAIQMPPTNIQGPVQNRPHPAPQGCTC